MVTMFVIAAMLSADGGSQDPPGRELGALLVEARARNPEIAAARRRADAATARVPQAGALPDPVLSVGLMNLPLSNPRLAGDEMALLFIQIAQMLPLAGTRGSLESVAREEQLAAEYRVAETERAVMARLKGAYYELYFVDHASEVLERNRALLDEFAGITRSRFAVGVTPQQDVLRAQAEVTRIDAQLTGLSMRRAALLAEINAMLDYPATRELSAPFPELVRRLAEMPLPAGAFTSPALEPAVGAGFPTLAELHAIAMAERPALRAQQHLLGRARAMAQYADRARIPDIEVMLGYGTQGSGGMNRMSAMVAVPLPLFAGRKQRQLVAEAQHEAAAVEEEIRALVAELQAEIAARLTEAVRVREQIVLIAEGVIPQALATVESAVAAYQAGTVEFLTLLDAQSMLFRNEIDLGRQFADFGRALAQLELAVGRDLIPEGGS